MQREGIATWMKAFSYACFLLSNSPLIYLQHETTHEGCEPESSFTTFYLFYMLRLLNNKLLYLLCIQATAATKFKNKARLNEVIIQLSVFPFSVFTSK